MRTNHPSLPPRPADPCPPCTSSSSSSKAPLLPQRPTTSSSMVASSSSSVPIPTTGHRLPPAPTGSPLPLYTSSSLHSPSSFSSSSGRTPATSYYQYYHYTGGVTAGSSSYSPSGSTFPSPSTSSVTSSASSSGSSLRTPPELLLQQHGMATMTTRDGGLVVIHSNGKSMGGGEVGIDVRRLDRAAKRFLSIQEIDERLQLLDSVALDNLDPTIPSAPPVLKQKSRPLSSSVGSQPGVSASIDSRVSVAGSKPAASSSSSSMAVIGKKPPSGQLLRSPPSTTSKTAKSTEEEVTPKAQRMTTSASSASNGSGTKKRRRSTSVEEGPESGQLEEAEVRKKSRPRTSGNRDYTPSPSPPPTRSKADASSLAAAKRPADVTKSVAAPLQRSKSSSSVPAFSRFSSSSTCPARTWTKEEFARLATIYQSRGRSLKHSGDRRIRDASPRASSTSRNSAQTIANYEQTEAIVLYLYAFWCEDQTLPAGGSSSRPCILTNWSSLSGLLHHVHRNHEKQGEHLLAALCLLLEAVVLKQVAGAEQRLIQQKMSQVANRMVAASTPGASSSSSSSGNALSEVSNSLMDLSSSMTKVLADEERSSKLFGLVRGTILSPDFFRLKLPKVYEACQKASVATSSERVGKMALALDPGSLPSTEDEKSTKEERWTWTWPLPFLEGSTMTTSGNSQSSSSTTASALHIPHLVCFARAVLQERARQKGVTDYRIAEISTTGGQ